MIQRKKVAIKCLKKSVVLTTEDGVEDVFKERRILELKYPFKCSLRYAFQDKKNLYIGNQLQSCEIKSFQQSCF